MDKRGWRAFPLLLALVAISLIFAPSGYGSAQHPRPLAAPTDTPDEDSPTDTPTPALTDTPALPTPADTDTPAPSDTDTPTPSSAATPTPTSAATPAPARPPPNLPLLASQPRYHFDATNLDVYGEFLSYWQSNGGLPVFGYPISPVQVENGRQVQYFERERFEFHPEEGDPAYRVQLGLLGTQVAQLQGADFGPPQPGGQSGVNTVYFAQTGRTVNRAFLSYWGAAGSQNGLHIYGYPISDEVQDGDLTVQYFERARFERKTSDSSGSSKGVQLALLGAQYFLYLTKQQVPPPIISPAPPLGVGGHPFLAGPNNGAGIIAQIYGQDKSKLLGLINAANFRWVKQQILWKDSESPKGSYHWGELDSIVASVNAAGVNLIVNVDKAPPWARDAASLAGGGEGFPKDPKDFGDFMGAMAARYRGQIKAYEIWNEPNLYNEVGGTVSPAAYAELLMHAYTAIKEADPNAIVIMGAPAPTGVYDLNLAIDDVAWLELMYKYKNGIIRGYYDVLGSHPYGYNNPPETLWPDQPSPAKEYKTHASFYFRRVEQQRAMMEKYGEGRKQMWVTEYGWCSDKRDGGFGWCDQLDQQAQADFIVRAIKMSRDKYPWMGVICLWNLNFSTIEPYWTGPALFSIINADYSPRPAYFAVQSVNANAP